VSDLSDEGCSLATNADLEVGEAVMLDLPGFGRADGQIRWRAAAKFGVQLLLEIDEK